MRRFAARTWPSFLALLVLVASLVEWIPIAAAMEPYRIGPDDVLAISVWDQRGLDRVVVVRPDGKISLPLVGEIDAGGLTPADLASHLTTLYRETMRRTMVTVSIKEIRSRQVFLLGGVVRPGSMPLTQELTVLQALSAVGGPIATADLESAFVLRGQARIPVNLRKVLESDLAQNLRLQPGDTIVVPSPRLVCLPGIDCVWVHGEVKNPGPVKYTKDLTITTAIEAVGGLTALASKPVLVTRDAPQDVSWMPGGRRNDEMLWFIMPNPSPRSVRSDARENNVDRIATRVPPAYINTWRPLMPGDLIIVPQKLF
jgi:polysaccharide export outer membrane protein